jgi:hypothetical protein
MVGIDHAAVKHFCAYISPRLWGPPAPAWSARTMQAPTMQAKPVPLRGHKNLGAYFKGLFKTQCFVGTCMVGTDHAGEALHK